MTCVDCSREIDDALLDRAPAQGEWSLRETFAHAIGVERSYRTATEYAIARTPAEPVMLPAERRPTPDPADTAGPGLEILVRFATRRAETDAALADAGQADLDRPTF